MNIIDGFYLEENSADFFENRYDYMADAVDTIQAKLSLAIESQRRGIPLISCMGTGNKLDPTLFRVSDITKTSVCPLCRVMRRELKVRGISHLKVVWSPEQPIKPNETAEVTSRRALPGSISFVPPVAGMIMAGEIIKDLINNVKLYNFTLPREEISMKKKIIRAAAAILVLTVALSFAFSGCSNKKDGGDETTTMPPEAVEAVQTLKLPYSKVISSIPLRQQVCSTSS